MKRVKEWSEDDKFILACEVIKNLESNVEKFKKIMNLARGFMDKAKIPTHGKQKACGQQRNVDPGASGCGQHLRDPALASAAQGLQMSVAGQEVCEQQRKVDPGASSVFAFGEAAPATQVKCLKF